jgi:hypothetical protein
VAVVLEYLDKEVVARLVRLATLPMVVVVEVVAQMVKAVIQVQI